jgi:tetratricopeptide (TPR) repeat protein
MPQSGREERLRRYWDKHARSYDRQMGFFDRHLFADSRRWICSRAEGRVLEVAVGTGLNLAWLERLDRELGNLRVALRWSLDSAAPEVALALGGSLGRFWYVRGHVAEGRRWLEEALEASAGADSSDRARALRVAAMLANYVGDLDSAELLAAGALALSAKLLDERGTAASLAALALAARSRGRYEECRRAYTESAAILRAYGESSQLAEVLARRRMHDAADKLGHEHGRGRVDRCGREDLEGSLPASGTFGPGQVASAAAAWRYGGSREPGCSFPRCAPGAADRGSASWLPAGAPADGHAARWAQRPHPPRPAQ